MVMPLRLCKKNKRVIKKEKVVCDVCSSAESTLSSLCQLVREERREPLTPAESRSLNKGSQETWFPQHSREDGGKKVPVTLQISKLSWYPAGFPMPAPFLHSARQHTWNTLACSSCSTGLLPSPLHPPLPSLPTHLKQGRVVASSE